ncbi:MAG: DUF6807 family protein [Bacteroidota bacterium]
MVKYIGCTFWLLLANLTFSQSIKVTIGDKGALFTENKDSVLFYQAIGKEEQGQYMRANYVHPLFSLDGQILTEDTPKDHLHHHGVFWAWHQLYIGDKRIGDAWENKFFKWEVMSVKPIKSKGSSKTIETQVVWKSPLWVDEQGKEKPFVSETTRITVYPSTKNYRIVDIQISLIANQPDTRIGGSEDPKGYGGFSPRIRLPEDIKFIGVNGEVEPKTNPVQSIGWLDMVGSLGANGTMAGVAMLSHPSNPGYPNPWILRSKGSMQNAVYPFPGAIPVPLSNINATVLRYRLVIHNGNLPDFNKLHQAYSQKSF